MSQIKLDAAAAGQLNQINFPVELCDPAGRVLGRFVPLIDLSKWEPVTPPATEEELNRREAASEKRYTTAEVFGKLESL
jgi:hypothetical protein